MTKTIHLASAFSHYARRAADKVGIPSDFTIARQCAELTFNAILETGDLDSMSPLEKNKYAQEEAIAWLKPRYESFQKYAADFFKESASYDREAVTAAMLCNGHMHLANLFANSGDPEVPTVFRNESVDEDVISRAQDIVNEAERIARTVLDGGGIEQFSPAPESVFLAHGFLWDALTESDDHGYEGCDTEQAQNIKDNLLTPIRSFIHGGTVLGQDVFRHITSIENYLDATAVPEPYRPAEGHPRPKRPGLSLVQPTQP